MIELPDFSGFFFVCNVRCLLVTRQCTLLPREAIMGNLLKKRKGGRSPKQADTNPNHCNDWGFLLEKGG
ncbi:hypothetical protein M23134_02701 [Microscilla marina ATCC 23134]|uniref:Uncharacterized protein n=1 Tax=Microscilla marina ATCC 23134 TaxID=313606 RepID=A1ZZW5_MICM2|nr:hypothetical protein M23134_02701 [Microscilla marina ATCC 23134]